MISFVCPVYPPGHMQSGVPKPDSFIECVGLSSIDARRKFELVASGLAGEMAGKRDQPPSNAAPTRIVRDDERRNPR